MSVWFLLWLCLLLALVYFLGWTLLILLRQKAAWQKYAKARKLRYKSGSLMASPEMEGMIDEHSVTFFTSEHMVESARGSRKLTAIEVNLNSVMPIVGGVASGSMVPILSQMNLKQECQPKHKSWNESYMAAASSRLAMESYLSDARLEALCGLMQVKNAWTILVFKNEAMLLRIDIASPLDKASDIDKLTKKMLAAAKVLELGKGEAKALKALADKPAHEAAEMMNEAHDDDGDEDYAVDDSAEQDQGKKTPNS